MAKTTKNTKSPKPTKEPKKMGRPVVITEAIIERICEEISTMPISLKTICKPKDMPAVSTVWRWIAENNDFKDRYARAKEAQANLLAEEILAIADDSRQDEEVRFDQDGNEYTVENKEYVNRSRLRIDARKWLAAKLLPKRFGDKVEIESNNTNTNHNTNETFVKFEYTPPKPVDE